MTEPKQKETATAKPIKGEDEQYKTVAVKISNDIGKLEVSLSTFNELKMLIKNAGYINAFEEDGTIDMTGIKVIQEQKPESVDVFINGKPYTMAFGDGRVSYQEIRNLAFPDSEFPKYPTCTWQSKLTGRSGIMSDGKDIPLETNLHFTIMDTSNA